MRLISGLIVVMGCVMVIAILISAILIATLIGVYISLIHHGVEPYMAALIVAFLSVLIVIFICVATVLYVYHLRQIPKRFLKRSPLASRAMSTLDAFTDGLMAE